MKPRACWQNLLTRKRRTDAGCMKIIRNAARADFYAVVKNLTSVGKARHWLLRIVAEWRHLTHCLIKENKYIRLVAVF